LAEVPGIPFSVEELERAEKMGQMLVLRVDKTTEGKPMSLEAMNVAVMERWQKEGKGALLSTPDSWEGFMTESYKKDAPRSGWALVSREVLPESCSKNYIEQTDVIIKTLKDEVFKGMEIPEKYAKSIAEFESQEERLTKLMNDDWQEAIPPRAFPLWLLAPRCLCAGRYPRFLGRGSFLSPGRAIYSSSTRSASSPSPLYVLHTKFECVALLLDFCDFDNGGAHPLSMYAYNENARGGDADAF